MAKAYFCVLIQFFFLLGTVVSNKESCCSGENYIVDINTSDVKYSCLDILTNATSELLLTCDNFNWPTDILQARTPADLQVNDDGNLVYKVLDNEYTFQKGKFCIGNLSNIGPSGVRNVAGVIVLCSEEERSASQETALGYCMIISTVFLLGTACIYIALPELRDLQGKSTINFCISLGAGLGIMAAMKLIEYSDMKLCAARGFFAYFFFIAAFFWSNAISVQILLSTRKTTQSTHGWKEFVWYALYAWGGPSILTISMAIVNFMPGNHRKPGLGLNHCWFFDTTLQWQYMYSVMTILLLINVGIFIYTSLLLWRHSFKSSNHLREVRYKLLMMIRLFVMMGIPWIFEMIGSLMDSYNIIWVLVTDVINSLQGVFIFLLLVVFRRRVVKLMHQHGWLECVSGKVEQWLAVGDDEDIAHHTVGVTLDEIK